MTAANSPRAISSMRSPSRLVTRAAIVVVAALTVLQMSSLAAAGTSPSGVAPALSHEAGLVPGAQLVAEARASLAPSHGPQTPKTSSAGWAEVSNTSWTLPFLPRVSATNNWSQAIAYDGADGYVILLSGQHTWTFSGKSWTLDTKGTTSPPVTAGMSMAWDPLDGYVLLFGGCCGGGNGWDQGVTWEFSGGVWWNITASVHTAPSSRAHSVLTWDTADQEMLLIDGTADYQCGLASPCTRNVSETWSYKSGTWTNLTSTAGAPPVRIQMGSVAADDSADGYVVWVGSGLNSDLETWKFVGGAWTNITTAAGPVPPREFASIAAGPAHGYLALFGGESCYGASCTTYFLGDTWEFLGGSWTNLTSGLVTPPAPRAGAYLTFDAAESVDLLVDGSSDPAYQSCLPASSPCSFLNDTWTFSFHIYVATPVASPPSGRLDAHTSVTFTTSAFGGDGTYTYLWTNLPTGCVFMDAPSFTCTPTGSGTFPVNVSVVDSNGATANSTHLPFVVNPPPSISSFTASPHSDIVGQPTTLSVLSSGGTSPFTYDYGGLPSGCLTTNSSTLVCTPTVTGFFQISVTVTDIDLDFASASLGLWVNPTALTVQAPLATPSSGQVDVTQNVELHTVVGGGTGVNTYNWNGLPTGCSPESLAWLNCTPTQRGNYTITVTVTDSNGTSVTSGALLYTVDSLPVAGSLVASPADLDTGATTVLSTTAWGGTPPLSYSYHDLPPGCSSTNAAQFSCTPTSAGTYQVKVNVTDATGNVSIATTTLVVGGLSFLNIGPPELVSGASEEDQGFAISLYINQVGGGDGGYSYQWSDLPAGCSSADSRWLNCTPDAAGNYSVTVSVTDRAGSTASSPGGLPLSVNAVPRFVASTVSPAPVEAGNATTFSAVEHGGTAPLSYDWIGLPPSVSGTEPCAAPKGPTLTCIPSTKGNYTVTLIVTDQDRLTAETNFTLEVTPVPVVPTTSSSGSSAPMWIYYALIGAVAAVVVLVFLLLWQRKGKSGATSEEEEWSESRPAPPKKKSGKPTGKGKDTSSEEKPVELED
jgi:hypothetical protein